MLSTRRALHHLRALALFRLPGAYRPIGRVAAGGRILVWKAAARLK
jgi:hypothetical protein